MVMGSDMIVWGNMAAWPYIAGYVACVLLLLLLRMHKVGSCVRFIAGTAPESYFFIGRLRLRRWIKTCMWVGALICFVGMLFRPQWDKVSEQVEQEGRDILIAVDISRSMLAQDEKPNRLDFAKAKIRKLLYNLSCERVGLILFSGATVVQCPLTTDYASFFMFLDQLDVETISSGTTSLDQPIEQALQVFSQMENKKTKLLFVFTDGEDFSGNLAGIKEKAQQEHLHIFTIGVGSAQGAPVPVLDGQGQRIGYEKDQYGAVIMSRLNEGILKNLAHISGGQYIHATTSDTDIAQLISHVQSYEKDRFDDTTVEKMQEQYSWFAWGMFLMLLIEWLL